SNLKARSPESSLPDWNFPVNWRAMGNRTFLYFLLTFLLYCALPVLAKKTETGFLDRTVSAGGITYRYQVFVPANFDPHKKWPVVLFLHGAGERGDNGLLQTEVGLGHAIRNRAADLPFGVVMPQCRAGQSWIDRDLH